MLRAAVLLTLAIPAVASAECPGRFASLAKYAGEYPDRFLKEPAVQSRTKALLGPAFSRFMTGLQVRGRIALIDCELVVEGNAAHRGGEQNALLAFSLGNGRITAGLLDSGEVTIFVSRSPVGIYRAYDNLPAFVRDWAFVASNGFRSRINMPPKVAIRISTEK